MQVVFINTMTPVDCDKSNFIDKNVRRFQFRL